MIAKALEIDRDLAEAHTTKALILLDEVNLRSSEEEFMKAIELKPSYASAHQWYFHLLLPELRWEEALTQIEKALELDPLSQIINLNHAGYFTAKRDYAKALELNKKAVELDPGYALAHFELAGVYGRMRMFDDMRREFMTGVGLVQASYPQVAKLTDAMIAYLEDDKEKVRRLMPELEAHIGEPLSSDALLMAGLCFFLVENDKGFEWLEKSYSRRESSLLSIAVDEMFDAVRADPRYQNLLERLGLKQELLVQ